MPPGYKLHQNLCTIKSYINKRHQYKTNPNTQTKQSKSNNKQNTDPIKVCYIQTTGHRLLWWECCWSHCSPLDHKQAGRSSDGDNETPTNSPSPTETEGRDSKKGQVSDRSMFRSSAFWKDKKNKKHAALLFTEWKNRWLCAFSLFWLSVVAAKLSSYLGRMKLNITDGSLKPQAQQRASAQSDSRRFSGQTHTKQQHSLSLQLIFADIWQSGFALMTTHKQRLFNKPPPLNKSISKIVKILRQTNDSLPPLCHLFISDSLKLYPCLMWVFLVFSL